MSNRTKQGSAAEPESAAGAQSPGAPALRKIAGNHVVYLAGLALIVIVLFGSFLFSDKMLYSSDQLTGLDAKMFYRTALIRHTQVPMWFSTRLCGMPTVDAMFGDIFYAPSILMHLALPVHRSMGLKMVLHVVLAGVFFYLMLVKGFGASPLPGFAGALLYMLNPQFVSHVYPGHAGKIFAIAWLPFVVWRMKVLMDSPRLINATLLTLGIGMSLYTAHVQMVYFILWGLFFYWLLNLVLHWREHREVKRLAAPAAYFWLAVFLGLGFAFIQFFPSFMYVRDAHSVRGVDRGFEYAASWSLHWPELFSLWVPEFAHYLDNYWNADNSFQFGNPFKLNTEYAGALPVLLAAAAVVFKPRRPWRIFWAAVAVFATLFALGAHTPVFHIVYYLVPGVKKMRACSMIMFWFSFSTVLLAALFLGDLLRGEHRELREEVSAKWKKGLLVALGVVTGLALLFSIKGFARGVAQAFVPTLQSGGKQAAFEANFTAHFVPALWLWWLIAAAAVGALWAVFAGKVDARALVALVVVAGLVDTFRVNRDFIKPVSARPYFHTDTELVKLRQRMRERPFRCLSLPGALQQNGEGVHGLEGLGDFHDNELRHYRAFRGDQSNRNYYQGLLRSGESGQPYVVPDALRRGNAFLNLANARYSILRTRQGLNVIENRGALGRLSLTREYVVLSDEEVVEALKRGTYDYRTTVALREEPAWKPPKAEGLDDSLAPKVPRLDVEWLTYTPNRRVARVRSEEDGFLRLSEVFYPGWEVRIDGEPARIHRADLTWMAVPLEKGEHEIEMLPHSMYMTTASAVTTPVVVGLLLYWIGFSLLRMKRRKASSDSKS